MLDSGAGIAVDDAEAGRWYRAAAEQGHGLAQLNLGILYDTGEGVEEDDALAREWYRKAADQDLGNAAFNLGLAWAVVKDLPQDLARAHMWLAASTAAGNPAAARALSVLEAAMSAEQLAEAQRLAAERAAATPPG